MEVKMIGSVAVGLVMGMATIRLLQRLGISLMPVSPSVPANVSIARV